MKKFAFAFAATLIIGAFATSAADAMTIGSLSRQNPVIASTDVATLAFPAVCRDLACGVSGKAASGIAPVLHIIFASIRSFALQAGVQPSGSAD